MCRAIRYGLILLIFLLFLVVFICLIEESFWLLYFCDLIFYKIVFLYREGVDKYFFESRFCLSCLVYQGSLNFIIYFCFPILKQLMIYVSYCFISINNRSLVVKCYSSLPLESSELLWYRW